MKKLLAVLVLAALSIAAAPSPVPDEIRTRKLVLVDAAGKVRATFSASEGASDTVLLAMRTPAGEGRLHIALSANGNATIGIHDATTARVLMSTQGTGAGMVVYDGKGRAAHILSTER